MTIKQLFKMIESKNELNELLGNNEKTYLTLTDEIFTIESDSGNSKFYTLKEMKKVLNYVYEKELAENIINLEFIKSEKYNNYFNNENYELGIFED